MSLKTEIALTNDPKVREKKKIQNYVKKEGKYISGLDYFHKKNKQTHKKKTIRFLRNVCILYHASPLLSANKNDTGNCALPHIMGGENIH